MTAGIAPNEVIVRDFFRTLSAGDLQGLQTLLTDDASWTPMVSGVPGAGTHRGRTVIIEQFLGPVRALFADGDPKVHVDALFSAGNFVIAETRALGRVRASNAEYDNRYCWVFELQNGRIREVREYMDSAYVLRVLFGGQGG